MVHHLVGVPKGVLKVLRAHGGAGMNVNLEDVPSEDMTGRVGKTGLHWAVIHGSYRRVIWVIEQGRLSGSGVNINARDDLGKTPLVWAIERSFLEEASKDRLYIACALIFGGADLKMMDNEGNSPLSLVRQEPSRLTQACRLMEMILSGLAPLNRVTNMHMTHNRIDGRILIRLELDHGPPLGRECFLI